MRAGKLARIVAATSVVAVMGIAIAGPADAGGHQADGLIRKTGKPNFKGNNNYGGGQTVTIRRAPGQTAKFDIACQSDGASGDLTAGIGTGVSGNFTRNIKLGGTNLNTEVGDSNGLFLDDVALGKTIVFKYKIKVSPAASPGEVHSPLFICGDGLAGPSGDDPNVVARVEVV
jgi:hypothetical protein